MSDGVSYDIDSYVKEKLERLQNSSKDMRAIFNIMTGEPEKLFAEYNDGYNITQIRYGQFKERTEAMAGALLEVLKDYPKASIIGLHMANCEEWLEIFWGLLICGYKPLLMNTRMSSVLLEDIIEKYEVKAVISDGRRFAESLLVKHVMLDELKESIKNANPMDSDQDGWANEIILMSSGTSNHVKLCVYNGATFVHQIEGNGRLNQICKPVKQHYQGEMKLLTFLPFYHVFGLTAVFMWFGFFCRSFVFLKDFSSDTLLNTVKRHKVTHIFSIPLLWNTIYDTVVRTAKDSGQYDKLMKAVNLYGKISKNKPLAKLLSKVAFKSVREQLFGDSIKFMISGGSAISPEVLRFFNAIGYHLANGYGMTEVGITSVELTSDWEHLTDTCVGLPFNSVNYKISEEGELLVSGETMADIVYEDGKVVDRTENGWFHTNDLAEERNGRFYILGRKDDVIIGPSGENINPDVLEQKIHIDGAEGICITTQSNGSNPVPVLVVKAPAYASKQQLIQLTEDANKVLSELNLTGTFARCILTKDSILEPDDFKLNRRKLASRLSSGAIRAIDPEKDQVTASIMAVKVAEVIAKNIGKDINEVSPESNMFYDLGVTSLDYYSIIMDVQREFRFTFPADLEITFQTASEIAEYMESNR